MFTSYSPYNELIVNIRRGLYRYIGGGSSRKVFDLNNGYVLKVAKNKAGIEQNRAEYRISSSDKSKLFAKVIREYNNYEAIIMQKANKVYDIEDIWYYFNVTTKEEFFFLYDIQRIKYKYNLLLGDINKCSSWGTLNNRMVLIDYGFTREIQKKYY